MPAIDEDGLEIVFRSISQDPEVAEDYRRSAANGLSIWSSPGGVAQIRMYELRRCLTWDSFRPEGGLVDRVLLKRIAAQLRRPRSINVLAAAIQDDLAIPMTKCTVVVPLRGVGLLEKPIQIGAYRFGSAETLLRGKSFGSVWRLNKKRRSSTMLVQFELDIPKLEKAVGREVVRRAEEALNLLAVSYLRRWFETGPPWEIAISGSRAWSWSTPSSRMKSIELPWWLEDMPYEVVPDWLEARQRVNQAPEVEAKGLPRFRNRIDGFVQLPPGRLQEDFRAAFQALGEAVRLMRRGSASLALAWSAFERAYAAETDGHRNIRSIANCVKLAVASKGTFSFPTELLALYEMRNKVVHEAHALHWDEEAGSRQLGIIYGHIEALLEYCRMHKMASRGDLRKALRSENTHAAARRWAMEVRDRVVGQRQFAVLPSYQASLNDQLAFWEEVEWFLLPKLIGPHPIWSKWASRRGR